MVADVGARIRSLRTAKGLTQAQLAEPQYTKAYISMLESGRTRASMKALEHIAGVLGVKPADLLGGAPSPATPQYSLLEAKRLIEQGRGADAIPILEKLEEGLTAGDQLVRLRYLAVAYNAIAQPKQAFPLIERAQRMAELLGDAEEQTRLKAVLAAAYMRTYAYEDAARLFRECVQACDDGVVIDPAFLFRRLVDLAIAQGNLRQSKQALAMYERAIELSQQFDDRPSLANLYAGMAKAYHDSGDLEAAIIYSQRSLQVYEDLGLLDQVACALDSAAALYVEHGNTTRARECLARAERLAAQAKHDSTLASIKASQAEVLAKTDAEAALEEAQSSSLFAMSALTPQLVRERVRDTILERIGDTPLVRLHRIGAGLRGELWAKVESANPGGSVKDRPSLWMVLAAEEDGRLRRGRVVLDATSGNTGVALAMVCAVRGHALELCMPDKVSIERKRIIRAFGARLVLTDPLEGTDGAIREAQRMAATDRDRYVYVDQYSNPANPLAHELGTGPEIWEQTARRVTHFVAGVGTSGTIVGVSAALRPKGVRIVALQPDDALHGIEGWKHMPTAIRPAIWDERVADEHRIVSTDDAIAMAKRLARDEGIFSGVSGGAAVATAAGGPRGETR